MYFQYIYTVKSN